MFLSDARNHLSFVSPSLDFSFLSHREKVKKHSEGTCDESVTTQEINQHVSILISATLCSEHSYDLMMHVPTAHANRIDSL
jgi:hypothetical protein